MNNIETIDRVQGEWRTVTKASEVTVGQRVRYILEGGDRYGYSRSDAPDRFMANKLQTTGYSIIFGNRIKPKLIQAFFPLPAKQKRKVAKVTVIKWSKTEWSFCFKLGCTNIDSDFFKSRTYALRGAGRFCKAIGYEIEVAK